MKNFYTKVLPILMLCSVSLLFLGYSGGITGQSKVGCTCHNPTADPNVSVLLKGPNTLAPGQTANYTLELSGGSAVKGGLNVSLSQGTIVIPVGIMDTKLVSGELTHTLPKTSVNNKTSFNFNVTAPTTGTEFSIFAAGNSVNGNSANSGDGWNTTDYKVKIATNPPVIVNKTFEVLATKIVPYYISGNLANIRTSFDANTKKDTALSKFNDTLKTNDSLFIFRVSQTSNLATVEAGIKINTKIGKDSTLASHIMFMSNTNSTTTPAIVPEVVNALKLVYTIKNKTNTAAKLYWATMGGVDYNRTNPQASIAEYTVGLSPQTGYGTNFNIERTQISHGDATKGIIFFHSDSSSQVIPANGTVEVTVYYYNNIQSKGTNNSGGSTVIKGEMLTLFNDLRIDSSYVRPPQMKEFIIYPRFINFGPGPFTPNSTKIDSVFVEGRNLTEDINLSISSNSVFKIKMAGASQYGSSIVLNKDSINKYFRMKMEVQFTAGNQTNYFDSIKVKIDSLKTDYVMLQAGPMGFDSSSFIKVSKYFISFGEIVPNQIKVDSFKVSGFNLRDSVSLRTKIGSTFKFKRKGDSQFVNHLKIPKDVNNQVDTTIIVQFIPGQNQMEIDTLSIETKNSPPTTVLLLAGMPYEKKSEPFLIFNVANLKGSPNCGDEMFTIPASPTTPPITYYAFTGLGWAVSSTSTCIKESLNVLTSTAGISIKIDSLQLAGFQKINTQYGNQPPGQGNLGDERIYANGVVDIMANNVLKLRLRNVILSNDNNYPPPFGDGLPNTGSIRAEAFGIIDTTVGDVTWISEISKNGTRVVGMNIESMDPVGMVTNDCPNGYGFYNGKVVLFSIPEMKYKYQIVSLPNQGNSINYTENISTQNFNASINFTKAIFGRDSLPVNTNSGRKYILAITNGSDDYQYQTPKNIKVLMNSPWFHSATTMRQYSANVTFDFTASAGQMPVSEIVFLSQRNDSLLPIPHQTYLGNNKIKIDSLRGWHDFTFGLKIQKPVLQLSTKLINFGTLKQHLTKDTTYTITNLSMTDTLRILNMISSSPVFKVNNYIRVIPPGGSRKDTVKFVPLGIGLATGGLAIASNTDKMIDTILFTANVVTSVSLGLEIPTVFSLEQNYPNPFNPKTTIKYGLPTESNVKIEVYNMLGQKVSELVNEVQSAHYYETIWDATNVSSGLYLFKIEATDINDSANKFTSVKKMVLLK